MKSAHQFFGRLLIGTGGLMAFFILLGFTGAELPVWIVNWTFAAFGLSLAGFAFTYRRWRPEEPPTNQPPDNQRRE